MKITKHGTVTITPDGKVHISDFHFAGNGKAANLGAAGILAMEWAIRALEESLKELREP